MVAPLFALLPPGTLEGQILGVVLVTLMTGIFVKRTAVARADCGANGTGVPASGCSPFAAVPVGCRPRGRDHRGRRRAPARRRRD